MYNIYESKEARDLSFYCVLDLIDSGRNFGESIRYMKLEKEKYLTYNDGLEAWKKKRGRNKYEKRDNLYVNGNKRKKEIRSKETQRG